MKTEQLKTRINSVRNIGQLTKAMQMVSAAKMRRSQEAALRARPYARYAFSLLRFFAERREEFSKIDEPLLRKRAGNRVCFAVVSSDKGLAGSFNNNVFRKSAAFLEKLRQEKADVDVAAVGRRTRDFFARREITPVAEWSRFSDVVTLSDTAPLADWILESYESGEYNRVHFCFTCFVSALQNRVEIHQVLPLEPENLEKIIGSIIPKTGKYREYATDAARFNFGGEGDFLLEPSAEAILKKLARELLKVYITHLVFESNASEHSARMVAMKNASENAENIGEELTLELNKARQASITQEVSEISTVKEALVAE